MRRTNLLLSVTTAVLLTVLAAQTLTPPALSVPIAFQGVTGQLRVYRPGAWHWARWKTHLPPSVVAFTDDQTGVIHARTPGYRRVLPHEASHLFDARTGVTDADDVLPACVAAPARFAFADQPSAATLRGETRSVQYYCAAGEIRARFRSFIVQSFCKDDSGPMFGLPGRADGCTKVPLYARMTLQEAVRAALGPAAP